MSSDKFAYILHDPAIHLTSLGFASVGHFSAPKMLGYLSTFINLSTGKDMENF